MANGNPWWLDFMNSQNATPGSMGGQTTGDFADYGYTPNEPWGPGENILARSGPGVTFAENARGVDFSGGGGDGGGSTGGSKTRTAEQWKSMADGSSMMAAGFADVIGAKKRMREQQGFADDAKLDIDKFYADAEAGKYDAKTNQKMLDAFSFGRRDLDINPSLSMAATAMDNMSTDPRMMASTLGNMNTSATRSMQDLQQRNLQNELANARGYGQYMGGLQTQNEGFQRGLATDRLKTDQLAFSTAMDNKMKMDEARRQGWGNIFSGAIETGTSFLGEDGMKIPKFQGGGDVMQQILAAQGQGEGGVPARQDLPGEESHEANPISMVTENGDVVGEATGGEIILNSEQTEEIENAVAVVDQAIEAGGEPSMEDLMAVYEAVSDTLSQPQFQDEQQASPQADPAQENMMAFLGGGEQMA